MTLYSIPLNQSSAQSVLHIKSARIHHRSHIRTLEDRFHTLMWYQLLLAAVSATGDTLV